MAKKRIIDARADDKGNITAVRFRGNKTFTPLDAAIRMAEQDRISNAHAVRPKGRSPYLRTNPDSSKGNNLDDMADR